MSGDLDGRTCIFHPTGGFSAGIGGFLLTGERESISGIINYSHLQHLTDCHRV
jgi:hypothetical protein